MTDQPKCDTCIFWVKAVKGLGTCHRNPPAFGISFQENGAEPVHAAQWPVTAQHDWCGQHDRFTKWWLDQKVEQKAEVKNG